ncbi:MAG: hypothetical protein LUH02_03305 [Erysipelotrichaceae bacterium]|nr:hypothetical protein [Erysipelotrichaceae bacterium]
MEETIMNNISNLRFEFNTKNKKKIVEIFNFRCRFIHQIKDDDLKLINNTMCLQVCLDNWSDKYDENSDSNFLKVLECLKKITDPSPGNAVLVLKAKIIGHDNDKNLDFVFTDNFIKGKHSLIGKYENDIEYIYT